MCINDCIKPPHENWADRVRVGENYSLYIFFNALWYLTTVNEYLF